jgi:hypothetical protein
MFSSRSKTGRRRLWDCCGTILALGDTTAVVSLAGNHRTLTVNALRCRILERRQRRLSFHMLDYTPRCEYGNHENGTFF